jgi:hypothetical protein
VAAPLTKISSPCHFLPFNYSPNRVFCCIRTPALLTLFCPVPVSVWRSTHNRLSMTSWHARSKLTMRSLSASSGTQCAIPKKIFASKYLKYECAVWRSREQLNQYSDYATGWATGVRSRPGAGNITLRHPASYPVGDGAFTLRDNGRGVKPTAHIHLIR